MLIKEELECLSERDIIDYINYNGYRNAIKINLGNKQLENLNKNELVDLLYNFESYLFTISFSNHAEYSEIKNICNNDKKTYKKQFLNETINIQNIINNFINDTLNDSERDELLYYMIINNKYNNIIINDIIKNYVKL